jgi:hypothetical protein
VHQQGGTFARVVGEIASSMDWIKGERKGEEKTRYVVRECLCVSESEIGRRGRERETKIDRLIEIDI